MKRLGQAPTGSVYQVGERPTFSVAFAPTADNNLCRYIDLPEGVGATGCDYDMAALARGEAAPEVVGTADGGAVIAALLPDGAAEVELTWADGRSQALEIKNSLASIRVKDLPRSISWITPAGDRREYAVAEVLRG